MPEKIVAVSPVDISAGDTAVGPQTTQTGGQTQRAQNVLDGSSCAPLSMRCMGGQVKSREGADGFFATLPWCGSQLTL